MSLDYPNRATWLAKRSTPRNLRLGRLIHVSSDMNGNGATFFEGRNAAKRARRAAHKAA